MSLNQLHNEYYQVCIDVSVLFLLARKFCVIINNRNIQSDFIEFHGILFFVMRRPAFNDSANINSILPYFVQLVMLLDFGV